MNFNVPGSQHRTVILPLLLLLMCAGTAFGQAVGVAAHPALAVGSNGNFFGTTTAGGAHRLGTMFEVTPTGTLTILYSFGDPEGKVPIDGMTLDKGDFYGTTIIGGANNDGTVFQITTAGVLTTLHSFSGPDGSQPWGSLMLGKDGNFYGTTSLGGANAGASGAGYGTIFKITPAGTLTTLHSFDGADGAYPYSGLTLGKDGDFYGVTYQGGANNEGAVFKITPAGKFTLLHSFNQVDGSEPQAELTLGEDGDYYSTTSHGGAHSAHDGHGYGTVFKITPTGTLTTLYNFNYVDGATPISGLMEGANHAFYGTTFHGGSTPGPDNLGIGTAFEITTTGVLTTLYNFTPATGEGPFNSLALRGGTFFGETNAGGANNNGTVFKISAAGKFALLCSL